MDTFGGEVSTDADAELLWRHSHEWGLLNNETAAVGCNPGSARTQHVVVLLLSISPEPQDVE